MTMFVPFRSRFSGCLLGGALGDALGYPIEFASGSELPAEGGPPPAELVVGPSGYALISDDTQMTLFTAEGLIRSVNRKRDADTPLVTTFIWNAYQRWLFTQTNRWTASGPSGLLVETPALRARRAPGNTCLSALTAHTDPVRIPSVTVPPNDSKGCGAVMRSAPIGMLRTSREQVFELARDAAATTHGHPSGYLSAAAFAVIIHELIDGKSILDGANTALGLLETQPAYEETSDAVRRGIAVGLAGTPSRRSLQSLGGGWVGEEALAIALACAISANPSPAGVADALWRAVVHDGDSDSTGSLTGNLLGAAFGRDNLPDAWLADLELAKLIERVADDLYRVARDGETLDYDDYPPC